MEPGSFIVGIRYKEGAPTRDKEVALLMAEHRFLEHPFDACHFRGQSALAPGELVTTLQNALAERSIEALVSVELLRPPRSFSE